jgi:hypothetical protein
LRSTHNGHAPQSLTVLSVWLGSAGFMEAGGDVAVNVSGSGSRDWVTAQVTINVNQSSQQRK